MLFRPSANQSVSEFPSLLVLKARSRRRRALEALAGSDRSTPRDPAWVVPFRHHAAA